jgi:hypothetical protein
MDTGAICQYLANTLKAAQSYDLLVLKSLVEEMTVCALWNQRCLARVCLLL